MDGLSWNILQSSSISLFNCYSCVTFSKLVLLFLSLSSFLEVTVKQNLNDHIQEPLHRNITTRMGNCNMKHYLTLKGVVHLTKQKIRTSFFNPQDSNTKLCRWRADHAQPPWTLSAQTSVSFPLLNWSIPPICNPFCFFNFFLTFIFIIYWAVNSTHFIFCFLWMQVLTISTKYTSHPFTLLSSGFSMNSREAKPPL